jgi:hypothetical protein
MIKQFFDLSLPRTCGLLLVIQLVCFSGLTNAATLEPRSDDYLPPDLRQRVEQLKADLDNIPTNQTNAKARAELTWQWLNAYALDGGYIPVNATQIVATILGNDHLAPRFANALNDTIREFILLDDHPEAIGELRADPGPFTAGSTATIEQTYTVGKRTIQTGGAFIVARHFMPNFGAWQANDSAAPNYISIETNNPRVSFVATSVQLSGMHGGFRSARPALAFEVASGTLERGNTVTIVYGDTRGGATGLSMPSFSSDRMPLPLYVAFEDRGQHFSLPIQPIKIQGSAITGVAGFAPSIVAPGEEFTLSIRARDRFFNRATGAVPHWQVSKNDTPWLEVAVANNSAITTQTVSIAEPGTYFLNITSADGQITGATNPILVTAEPRDRIYWGDTHGHSGFAEGIGTPERFMVWARDDARLDYVTHSEHDIWLDDAEWNVLKNNVSRFSKEGEFIAYLGYEWTVNTTRGGHHNVLFRNPKNRNRIPAQFYPTLTSLYQGLRNAADPRDVVVIPHAHQAGDYRTSDPELEPLVEIMSQHGNFEWFGRMYLQHGHQVGFVAASDNHLSQPGYSAPLGGSLSQRGGLGAVLASARTEDAIFDGMKQLKAYATTGDRIILDFAVNGTGMGQRGEFATERMVRGNVIGTAPIDNISIVKNEQVVWQKSYLDAADDKLNKTDTFLLSFSSASHPFHEHDNPRGWRAWEGTLEVQNATLDSIVPVDASFPMQTVNAVADDPNRVVFATKTRGDTSSYLVQLSGIQRSSRLSFDLVETVESGGAPPVYRPPQRISADSFILNLRDLDEGRVTHTQTTDGYQDQTILRRIITDGPTEVAFEFADSGDKQGDYYFVRVVQANDAIAWSSPVWIGGHNKR